MAGGKLGEPSPKYRVQKHNSACLFSQATGFELNMRMALRAQSQCRATLETLAAIKNPPIVYARQANVTTGQQQINNGTASNAHADEIKNQKTQLSEVKNGLLPDA